MTTNHSPYVAEATVLTAIVFVVCLMTLGNPIAAGIVAGFTWTLVYAVRQVRDRRARTE